MTQDFSNNVTENTSDNSGGAELSLDERIEQVLNEPDDKETTQESADGKQQEPPAPSKNEDNNIDCPDKFKNEDGSINIKNLAKSYRELEPLLNEKTNWEKERAELLKTKEQFDAIQKRNEDSAKSAGFNSALDMQQSYQVAQYEANEYAKYLPYLDDETRQSVQSLLYQYSNNPSPSIMEQIEVEFAPEVNKRIAIQADRMKRQFEIDRQTQAQTQQMSNIEGIISQSVDNHGEVFKYEPFKNLFVNALHKFGDRFTYEDAEALIGAVMELKKAFQEEFNSTTDTANANKEATDKLADITGQSSAPSNISVDINKMTPQQLDKLLDKYI